MTFSIPRIEKERKPITDLIQPKGGSTITLRRRYNLRLRFDRRFLCMRSVAGPAFVIRASLTLLAPAECHVRVDLHLLERLEVLLRFVA